MQEIKTAVKQRQRKPNAKQKEINSLKNIHHSIYSAYEKYLEGDSEAIKKLAPAHREILEKCIKAASNGKTAYQASQETGIISDAFCIMTAIKKRIRRQQLKYKTKDVYRDDILKIVKNTKVEVCTTDYIAKKCNCEQGRVRYQLYLLEKEGKVQQTVTRRLSHWQAVTEEVKV